MAKNARGHGSVAKHGMIDTRTYRVWEGMKSRCFNPNHPKYYRYGGRGIKVCDRWLSFVNFYEDMKDCPSSEHSIERKRLNGNYEPDNCIWATAVEQCNNRSTNRYMTIDGETKTIAQWYRTGKFACSRSNLYLIANKRAAAK